MASSAIRRTMQTKNKTKTIDRPCPCFLLFRYFYPDHAWGAAGEHVQHRADFLLAISSADNWERSNQVITCTVTLSSTLQLRILPV